MPVLDTPVVLPVADVAAAGATAVVALAGTEAAPLVAPVLDTDGALVVAGYALVAATLDEMVPDETVAPDDVDKEAAGAEVVGDVPVAKEAAGVDDAGVPDDVGKTAAGAGVVAKAGATEMTGGALDVVCAGTLTATAGTIVGEIVGDVDAVDWMAGDVAAATGMADVVVEALEATGVEVLTAERRD